MKIKTFEVSKDIYKNQCYLIYRNNNGLLIDPAWDYGLIKKYADANNITLNAILLTHSHNDHTNLAQEFAYNLNIPVFMSGKEIDNYNFTCYNLKRLSHLEQTKIGEFEVISIYTPGHTSGSMCYLIDNNVFSGDTVFIEGVGVCNKMGSDVIQMFNSIQFLKSYLNKDAIFWPGHTFGESPGKTLEFLLAQNIYFQLDKLENFTAFRMRKKQPNPFIFK